MDESYIYDRFFQKFSGNVLRWIPEGLINIDLALLQRLDLLNYNKKELERDPSLTRYFHVIEGNDKVTLHNDFFVVWITPDKRGNQPVTYALVAIKRANELHLELGFIASGVYNTSRLVLRVLEKLLNEIEENEAIITKMEAM